MGTVAIATEGQVARPLRVLASLIKEKLQEAADAAEEATRPYWAEIGELLLEAKGQFDKATEFYEWSKRQFDIGDKQTQRYIQAVTSASIRRHGVASGGGAASLSEALRSAGKSPRGHHGVASREWVRPVDDIADRARREAERVREMELTRQQERKAEQILALRLIDIGWKVLAKELHPDSGGSRDAMQRLNRVRDRLKAHA